MNRLLRNAIMLALALALTASLALAASPARAQRDGLTMNATAAFGGYFKYGEWLPVLVELENQGRDLDGEVRVQINSPQGNMAFTAPVSLPSGSRKLVPVYVLANNFSREIEVRLVSGGSAVLTQKTTVRPQPNISYFVGILSPERGALALVNGIKTVGQERPKILVDLDLSQLPERVEGLRSFDLIILNDTDTSSLTPDQADTLLVWVQQGGRLVIGGGAGAQRTLAGLPQSLLPVTLKGNAELSRDDLSELADYADDSPILASGSFVTAVADPGGSRVLVGDNRMPLVAERAVGSGVVNFIALELSGLPFNGWPGTSSLWQALAGPGASYPEGLPFDMSSRQLRANYLNYPLSNIPSLDLPSVRGISLLLALYILLVGPINYLVLRWRKQLHLAWVTIPILTLLFTAGSFGLGYSMRGNDLVINKISLVQVNDSGNAAVTSYMGLFSPRQQSYEVNVQGDGLLSPLLNYYDMNPWNPTGNSSGTGEMIFTQGTPSTVKGLTVNQWAMQSFMAEGTWQGFGRLTGSLTIGNDVLVGTVRNETSHTLIDAVVTMNNRFVRLGNMAPGDERPVNLGLANVESDRFAPQLSYRLFQDHSNSGQPNREIEMKINIFNAVFESGVWGKGFDGPVTSANSSAASGILMFGWLDQAPPEVAVVGSPITSRTTALVFTRLDYQYTEDGFISLPPGILPGRISVMPRDGGNCGWTTSVHMARGEAEFEYRVPDRLVGPQIQSLRLSMWRDNPSPWSMPEISLYDWPAENWTTITEPIQGINVIKDAAPYVNDNGIIRVRIASESDAFGCIYVDMGLEANLAAAPEGN